MRQKTNPPKIARVLNKTPKKSHDEFPSLKNFQKLNAYSFFMIPYKDIIRGHYHESSDCFEYPEKKPYLNQATKIRKLAKFSFPPKKPGIENSNPSKILRSSPVTLNLENPPRDIVTRLESQSIHVSTNR